MGPRTTIVPAAILIDIDNTVYRYEPCHRSGMRHASAIAADLLPAWKSKESFQADYAKAREAIQSHLKGTAASHCRLLYFKKATEIRFGSSNLAAATELESAYWHGYFLEMRVEPGCIETLSRWHDAGIAIAWVTNYTTHRQIQKLRHLGLEKSARFLITSEEVGREKPKPDIFRYALNALAVEGEVVVIGDDFECDIAPAIELGFRTLWLDRESLPVGQVGSGKRSAVVADWKAISDHIPTFFKASN